MFAEIGELIGLIIGVWFIYYMFSSSIKQKKKKSPYKSKKKKTNYKEYSDAEKLKYYQNKNRKEKGKYKKK